MNIISVFANQIVKKKSYHINVKTKSNKYLLSFIKKEIFYQNYCFNQ